MHTLGPLKVMAFALAVAASAVNVTSPAGVTSSYTGSAFSLGSFGARPPSGKPGAVYRPSGYVGALPGCYNSTAIHGCLNSQALPGIPQNTSAISSPPATSSRGTPLTVFGGEPYAILDPHGVQSSALVSSSSSAPIYFGGPVTRPHTYSSGNRRPLDFPKAAPASSAPLASGAPLDALPTVVLEPLVKHSTVTVTSTVVSTVTSLVTASCGLDKTTVLNPSESVAPLPQTTPPPVATRPSKSAAPPALTTAPPTKSLEYTKGLGLTVQITNSYGPKLSVSYEENVGFPGPIGSPTPGPVGDSTQVVLPTGWGGRLHVGPRFHPWDTKLEGTFGYGRKAFLDVSYVDGYTVPMTCSCDDYTFTGCNIELFDTGITCPEEIDGFLCRNPMFYKQEEYKGPAHPFFAACARYAYTFPGDDISTWGGCHSDTISCCVGSTCPVNTRLSKKRSLSRIEREPREP